MEPIISKLQEGVKYPRFERDATKTINDLVEHITKERGVYSSSIEPNPSEHNIWFNTNDNTLYIYNKGVWKTVSDKNTDILDEPIVFYCNNAKLYYNGNNGGTSIGFYIGGYYNKDRLKYIIEDNEGKPIEDIVLTGIFIEPKDSATIIIGEDESISNICIIGEDLDNANIYMYNKILHIGGNGDNVIDYDNINILSSTIYCNCKRIGNITITHENSSLGLYISDITIVVGNNNTSIINKSVADWVDEFYIYIVKETDNDKSKVSLPNAIGGCIEEYVNLCGTTMTGISHNGIECHTFITTTLNDIDKNNITDSCIDFRFCRNLIIDDTYKTFNSTTFINYLQTCKSLKVYVTDIQLHDFLKSQGLKPIMVVANNSYYDDKVIVNYKTTDGTDIYNNTIYRR